MTIPITANVVSSHMRTETAATSEGRPEPSAHHHRQSGSTGQEVQASDAFQRALHGGPARTDGVATQPADSVSGASQSSAVHPASETSPASLQQPTRGPRSVGPGDRILAGLQRSQNQLMSTVEAVAKTSETQASISPAELFKLQLQVTHDTTNESIAGEVGGKVDNDLQTLLKG